MFYSFEKKALFFFCCKLPEKTTRVFSVVHLKFSSWKKIISQNRRPFIVSGMQGQRISLKKGGLIDDRLLQQIKWNKILSDILKFIIVTIQILAQQNLVLRGHRESISEDLNPGNFLTLLMYLNKFDPMMKTHMESISAIKGICHTFLTTFRTKSFCYQETKLENPSIQQSMLRFTSEFLLIQLQILVMKNKWLRS